MVKIIHMGETGLCAMGVFSFPKGKYGPDPVKRWRQVAITSIRRGCAIRHSHHEHRGHEQSGHQGKHRGSYSKSERSRPHSKEARPGDKGPYEQRFSRIVDGTPVVAFPVATPSWFHKSDLSPERISSREGMGTRTWGPKKMGSRLQ